MEMIKKGINPLDMDMNELNETAQEIRTELGEDDTELYQKYLWKLEQNNKITKEERKSYIGIYRLIAQVEKADSAAIGSLVQQGTEITMRSLLTAVRVGQKTPVDYRIGDRISGVRNDKKNAKIDDQIMASYHQNCLHDAKEKMTPKAAEKLSSRDYEKMTPEQIKEVVEQAVADDREVDKALEQKYIYQQMEDFSEVLATPEEIYDYLERSSLPNTMNNLMAVREMLKNRNQMFDTLWNASGATQSSMEAIEEMKAKVLQRFGEAIKSPEEMADAQETLAEVAEHVMDTMIIENDQTGTLDLKALRLMNTQFSICAKQAKSESYMIPVQTADGVTGVSLKIVRGTKKKGMVDILFRSNSVGKVAATFEAKEKGFSGMLVTDNPETKRQISGQLTELALALRGPKKEKIDLRVTVVDNIDMERYENRVIERQMPEADADMTGTDDQEPISEEEYNVQTSRLYHIAESFIQAMQKFM
jgi:co-chaperonin GroES (HSP10)